MFRNHRFLLSLAVAGLCFGSQAAVPPAQKLLPKDTVLVVTAPDWTKARAFVTSTPYGQLWQDPAMKPFADKFIDKFTTSVLKPAEQSLGIKFSDYEGLLQGQVTFAIVRVTQKNKTDDPVAGILLVDAKDHAGLLKTDLAQIIKKWADAGKPMKTQKIRDVDFTTIIASPDDLSLSKVVPKPGSPPPPPDDAAAKPATNKVEITLGQSGSLLLVSDSPDAIEKVLSLQAGGMAPPLEESPAFQADYGARLRESPFYVWLNIKTLVNILTNSAAADSSAAASPVSMTAILNTTGVANLTSTSFSWQNWPGGTGAQLFVAVPEDKRPALLKIFAADAKDSSPPSFVPGDAVKFSRWRLNVSRSYKALEAMVTELSPEMMAGFDAAFKMAGKDKDEHYDLKSELLDNAGDDIISYSRAPKSAALADWKSPPSLVLLGSSQPEKLAAAVKVVMGLVTMGAPIKDREFLGRKIYTAGAPAVPGAPPAAGAASPGLSFSASGGYVAFSEDPAILEEYLRSSGSTSKTLMDTPGLADVAQKTGGMSTGLFGFQNDNLAMRPLFDVLKKQPNALAEFFSSPLPGAPASVPGPFDSVRDWADFSLLPPFDTVSKYFYYSVYAGSFSPDGFALKTYAPLPPQLHQ